MSDVDGTLTPIVGDPQDACLAADVRRSAQTVASSSCTRLGIISGRDLEDVRDRVRVRDAMYRGCHGLEIEGPGITFRHPAATAMRESLALLAVLLREHTAGGTPRWRTGADFNAWIAGQCRARAVPSAHAVRRAVLIALALYLTADYCDPSIPGVFSFGTKSFFVDSVETRSAARAVLPLATAPLRVSAVATPSPAAALQSPRPRLERRPYGPRANVAVSPHAPPEPGEDH